MFFIVNKTKQTISLSDINIILGPRQAIDLDKAKVPRSKSDFSPSLSMAQKRGQIEVRSKDGKSPNSLLKQPQSNPKDELESLKEQLREVKDLLTQQSKTPSNGVSKEDLSNFAKEIIQSIPKSETVIAHEDQTVEQRIDEEVEVDDDILSEISKRAANKMVKNVENVDIKCEGEKQKNDLDSNIDELEGLL